MTDPHDDLTPDAAGPPDAADGSAADRPEHAAAGEGGPAPSAASPEGAGAEQGAGPEPGAETAEQAEADELTVTRMALEERTLDLQRVQAEYANYRKRVERDRELVKENAVYAALSPIVEVLDTIDRAREHGELSEDLATVAGQLERVVAAQGLVKFGAPGDAFDPTLHEALSHLGTDAEVEVTTCKVVAKAGFMIGDRVVRAAQVLVVDPAEG